MKKKKVSKNFIEIDFFQHWPELSKMSHHSVLVFEIDSIVWNNVVMYVNKAGEELVHLLHTEMQSQLCEVMAPHQNRNKIL